MPLIGPSTPPGILAKIAPWILPRRNAPARQRFPAGGPAGQTVATFEPLATDTLNLRLGQIARVKMYGRNAAGDIVPVESQRYSLTPPTEKPEFVRTGAGAQPRIGRYFSIEKDDPSPPDPAICLVRSLAVGDASIYLYADADVNDPVVPLYKTLNVHVYRPATSLELIYRLSGTQEDISYTGTGDIVIPIDHTATLRLQGRDSTFAEAEIANENICAGLGCPSTPTTRYDLVNNGDGTWTLTPLETTEPFAELRMEADGDPYQPSPLLTLFGTVHILPALADHLTVEAGIQDA